MTVGGRAPLLAHWALVCAAVAGLASSKPACCFRYRNWHNPCSNITCPNNAQCVPAVNTERHYQCMCVNECWDVGDSEDSGPVCGSDGRTYPSLCHMRRASCHAVYHVEVRYKGECDPCGGNICPPTQRCLLDADRNPHCACKECVPGQSPRRLVCGNDGKTYADECSMEYESCRHGQNVTKLRDGACPVGLYCQARCQHPYMECRVDPATGHSECRCPANCPAVLRPVCGSDNATYDSVCHLRMRACAEGRRVQPLYRGDCGQPAWCGRPRGGGNGGCPHGGVCRVRIAEEAGRVGGGRWSVRATCERPECLQPSDPELGRVCGSDGVTYKSKCFLQQRAFDLRNDELTVRSSGSCDPCRGYECPFYGFCRVNSRGEPECHCQNNCLYVYSPVCGSDGVTYDLECDLRWQACLRQMDISVVTRGPCPRPTERPGLAADSPGEF